MPDAVPETIWTRSRHGSRGPQRELSPEQLAATAVALADEAGLRAVTMRAVAQALGTTAGGLYRYVRGRDELVALMVDAALGDLRYPAAEGTWKQQLLAVAQEQLRVYRAHPWLVEAALRPGPLGPQSLRYLDSCLAIMAEVPAGTTAKMEALAMTTGVVTLFARPEAVAPTDPRLLFAALDPQAQPTLAEVLTAPPVAAAARPDLFERTLAGLLDGLLSTTT